MLTAALLAKTVHLFEGLNESNCNQTAFSAACTDCASSRESSLIAVRLIIPTKLIKKHTEQLVWGRRAVGYDSTCRQSGLRQ